VMKSWSHYIDVEQTNFRMRHIYVEKVKWDGEERDNEMEERERKRKSKRE
jgi:hypothetical protein